MLRDHSRWRLLRWQLELAQTDNKVMDIGTDFDHIVGPYNIASRQPVVALALAAAPHIDQGRMAGLVYIAAVDMDHGTPVPSNQDMHTAMHLQLHLQVLC